MFWNRKPKKPAGEGRQMHGTKSPSSFVVTCTNGCTRLECTSKEEAQTFQRCMQRCPQCGGDLAVNRFGTQESDPGEVPKKISESC